MRDTKLDARRKLIELIRIRTGLKSLVELQIVVKMREFNSSPGMALANG